jgi:hypothetical protein
MDIEPLIGMIRGSPELHGWTHTYVGATATGATALLLKPACEWIVCWWNAETRRNHLEWLAGADGIRWGAAIAGSFIGTYSHVALDSIMHLDMEPLRPFADGNRLLLLTDVDTLYLSCLAAGVAGLASWTALAFRRRQAQPSA